MNLRVLLRPEAETDLREARNWYDRQSTGLGDRLIDAADEAFERLAFMPERHRPVWKDVRKAKLHTFPYLVYFRILADTIDVVAILHERRDERAWRKRV